jgi:hypothetical protein
MTRLRIRSEERRDADRRGRVEVPGGLVGQQDRRAVDEGARDRHALLLAAGQLVGEALLLAPQADELEGVRHRGEDVVAWLADHLQRERHVLEHRLGRQQAEVLEHRADLPAQVRHLPRRQGGQVAAGDEDAARRRALLPQHQAQEGRLAGTGGSDEEDELPALDLEVHAVERRSGTPRVDLGDVLEADQRALAGRRATPGRRRERPRIRPPCS